MTLNTHSQVAKIYNFRSYTSTLFSQSTTATKHSPFCVINLFLDVTYCNFLKFVKKITLEKKETKISVFTFLRNSSRFHKILGGIVFFKKGGKS